MKKRNIYIELNLGKWVRLRLSENKVEPARPAFNWLVVLLTLGITLLW